MRAGAPLAPQSSLAALSWNRRYPYVYTGVLCQALPFGHSGVAKFIDACPRHLYAMGCSLHDDPREMKLAAALPFSLPADVSLAEGLYSALREEIMAGTLAAGTRLRETEVAQRFGVSRTPVREALKKLELEGLVADVPGRSLTVTKPSLNDILDAYLIREVLEGLATRLAAERALEPEVMMMGSILRQIEEANNGGDADRTIELSYQFDDLIFRSARNPRLHRIIEASRAAQGSSRRGNMHDPSRRARSIEERKQIFAAVQKREAKAAELAAQEHLRRAREYRIERSLNEEIVI